MKRIEVGGYVFTLNEIKNMALDRADDDVVTLCSYISRTHGIELTLKEAEKLMSVIAENFRDDNANSTTAT